MTNLITEALNKAAAIRDEAIKKAQEALRPGLVDFLKEHPEVEALRWTQYAPYFNDGEECVFGVNELQACLKVNKEKNKGTDDEDAEDDEGDWEDCCGSRSGEFSAATWKDLVALNKTLQGAEDVLKEAFGNHVQVIVTRKGIDVEEYEHD